MIARDGFISSGYNLEVYELKQLMKFQKGDVNVRAIYRIYDGVIKAMVNAPEKCLLHGQKAEDVLV